MPRACLRRPLPRVGDVKARAHLLPGVGFGVDLQDAQLEDVARMGSDHAFREQLFAELGV